MYSLSSYGGMIADAGRLVAYKQALEKRVRDGCVVLDLGTGTGVMALLACSQGARKVYAVESANVIHVAREIAAANGVAERITFIQASSRDTALPEMVDGIVADLRGVLPLFGSGLKSMLDARERFLNPDGWIVAHEDTLWTAVVSAPREYSDLVGGWETVGHFDWSAARRRTLNTWRRARLVRTQVLCEPQAWATISYRLFQSPSYEGVAHCVVERDAVAHGLAVWFDTETAPGSGFSNSPLSSESHIYGQGFFPWPQPTMLRAGSAIEVCIRADFVVSEYVWSWDSCLRDRSGHVVATYRQSSFFEQPIPHARLAKRAHSFRPRLHVEADVDRRILELMTAGNRLGEIAATIRAEFPERFVDWNEALGRVGDLSERYSK